MTHSAPQSRRSPRGCYRKTWGVTAANPHIWERAARAGRTCPAQKVSMVLAPGLHQAPIPADLAPQHPLGLRPPTCPPLALADPPAPGASALPGAEGVAGQSRPAQAHLAQLSTRPGGGGQALPGQHTRRTRSAQGPRHASGNHRPGQGAGRAARGRAGSAVRQCAPLATGCLLESSLEKKEASAQGPSCPGHPQILQGPASQAFP